MQAIIASPVAWINAAFIVMALFVPTVKDLLTPELEISLVASFNGIVAIIERIKAK